MTEAKAVVKQLQGITFAGKTDSNHWVMMDGPENFGGSDAGIRPKELLLLALGGCTGSDVASILQKRRIKMDGFELNLKAEVTEEHPKVYKNIHVEYVFYGKDIKTKDVELALEMSQTKYCGVSAMLSKAVEITHSYRIEENR